VPLLALLRDGFSRRGRGGGALGLIDRRGILQTGGGKKGRGWAPPRWAQSLQLSRPPESCAEARDPIGLYPAYLLAASLSKEATNGLPRFMAVGWALILSDV